MLCPWAFYQSGTACTMNRWTVAISLFVVLSLPALACTDTTSTSTPAFEEAPTVAASTIVVIPLTPPATLIPPGPTLNRSPATPRANTVAASTPLPTIAAAACPTVAVDGPSQSPGTLLISFQATVKQTAEGCSLHGEIQVDPGDHGVSAGEVHLLFDSALLHLTEIEVGDLLGAQPLVGHQAIDNDQGTMGLALARVGQTTSSTPAGIFASVKGELLSSAPGAIYKITIGDVEPYVTGFVDENFHDISQIKSQGATVHVQ